MREVVYFLPPRVSETDWAALPRVSWAEARTPLDWFEASSEPPRRLSEAFWEVDLVSEG